MGITRRALITTGAVAVGAIAFGGVLELAGNGNEMLRPPVVTDEADFMSKCIRCYRCISACPQGILAPATLNDGILIAKTPTVDFHQGSCDFCNKCVEVCPTSALTEADPDDPGSGRIGYAVVQTDRCLAYYGGCLVCYESCPYGAINLDSASHPIVDATVCNGCGVCEYECPALVYRSFSGGSRHGIVVVRNEAAENSLAATVET
ncbi:MAG: 4Fe-4S dicluster domain-containing protein [Eggerthellaceae bacterium]|nr:4Fe-4S dicluster domain-containing protein [Eggerthellaceae bacterium]